MMTDFLNLMAVYKKNAKSLGKANRIHQAKARAEGL
jgi:hypothetical protein